MDAQLMLDKSTCIAAKTMIERTVIPIDTGRLHRPSPRKLLKTVSSITGAKTAIISKERKKGIVA